MKTLETKFRQVRSLVFNDAIVIYNSTEGRPNYQHANPEFAGTKTNADFFYNPAWLDLHVLENYIDDEEDFEELIKELKIWQSIKMDFAIGKIDLNFLGHEKTAVIFLLNFLAKKV